MAAKGRIIAMMKAVEKGQFDSGSLSTPFHGMLRTGLSLRSLPTGSLK